MNQQDTNKGVAGDCSTGKTSWVGLIFWAEDVSAQPTDNAYPIKLSVKRTDGRSSSPFGAGGKFISCLITILPLLLHFSGTTFKTNRKTGDLIGKRQGEKSSTQSEAKPIKVKVVEREVVRREPPYLTRGILAIRAGNAHRHRNSLSFGILIGFWRLVNSLRCWKSGTCVACWDKYM